MQNSFESVLSRLSLEQIDTYLYRWQGNNAGIVRIYGGQVIAQAYIAACATVEDDSAPHSLHAYFIRPGVLKQPVLYSVDPIRNGKSFHTRTVKAIQNNEVIFTMTISFQKAEEGITHTVAMPDVPQPEDLKTEQELRKSNIDNIPKELQEIFLKEREYSIKWVEWNDKGGVFEYCPNIREPGNENFEEVQKVIAGDRTRVRQLKLEPGDLQIFKGRFTLHRVTKVEGQKSRYMCIPAYVLDPWRVNTPEHSKAIYGKVLPIHIERNQARSDGLTD